MVRETQALNSRLMRFTTLALERDRPVPFESEALQGEQDLLRRPGLLSRRIDILDPEQPMAASRASLEVTDDGGQE